MGDEAKRLEQRGDFRDVVIDRLHQQGPRIAAQFGEARWCQRAMLQFPAIGRGLADQPRFNLRFAGKTREVVGIERICPMLPRVADQQRLLLPNVAEKPLRIEIPELRH